MCVQKKIVIERTRDLIYLKFVVIDFFPKIIPVLAKTPVIQCSPCYSDRHLDIGLQVVEAHPLFANFLEKRLAIIPTSPFFIY